MSASLAGLDCGELHVLQAVLYETNFSRIHLGRDPETHEQIVVKLLRDDLPDDVTAEYTVRFIREARNLQSLEHPNLIEFHSQGLSDGLPWIATKYVPFGTLRENMVPYSSGWERFLELAEQMASAIDYLHAEGVVHRDIKPENVLIDDGWRVRICDLGLCRREDDDGSLTRLLPAAGTLDYLAPELRRRNSQAKASAATDIYSFAVVLYEIYTGGQLPCGLLEIRNTSARETFEKALSPNPDARFKTCASLVKRLSKVTENARWFYRLRVWIAAGILIAGSLVFCGVINDGPHVTSTTGYVSDRVMWFFLGAIGFRLVREIRS